MLRFRLKGHENGSQRQGVDSCARSPGKTDVLWGGPTPLVKRVRLALREPEDGALEPEKQSSQTSKGRRSFAWPLTLFAFFGDAIPSPPIEIVVRVYSTVNDDIPSASRACQSGETALGL